MEKSKKGLPQCAEVCIHTGQVCGQTECRMFIDYSDDLNCSLISIYKNGNMTLDEISKRLGISLVRVSQIEKKAIGKLSKRIKTDHFD